MAFVSIRMAKAREKEEPLAWAESFVLSSNLRKKIEKMMQVGVPPNEL
jgi:hypothetical protein